MPRKVEMDEIVSEFTAREKARLEELISMNYTF